MAGVQGIGEKEQRVKSATKQAKGIIRDARRRGVTIAVAESLTGGKLASTLVAVPGASAVFRLGVVAYAAEMKRRVLKVDAKLLDKHGAVHPKVAKQMAEGVRKLGAIGKDSASIGVATTGVAGPDPQDGQEVGLVYIGVSVGDETTAHEFRFEGGRNEIRYSTTQAALKLVEEALGKFKGKSDPKPE